MNTIDESSYDKLQYKEVSKKFQPGTAYLRKNFPQPWPWSSKVYQVTIVVSIPAYTRTDPIAPTTTFADIVWKPWQIIYEHF